MAITKVISALAFASVALLLLHQTAPVDAFCACLAVYYSPSDYANMGAVVVRAKVLSRSSQADANDEVTYKVRTTTLYAGEPDVDYGKYISFVTAASTDDCGSYLAIGGDYVLSLFRRSSAASDSEEDQPLTLDACDLDKSWSSLLASEKEDLADMLEGSDDDDGSY